MTYGPPDPFLAWYLPIARAHGLDPNADSPLHFYDYRAAYEAGKGPNAQGHWPSEYKRLGHPNLIVGGRDTRNGLLASVQLMQANERENARVRAALGSEVSGYRTNLGQSDRAGFRSHPDVRLLLRAYDA